MEVREAERTATNLTVGKEGEKEAARDGAIRQSHNPGMALKEVVTTAANHTRGTILDRRDCPFSSPASPGRPGLARAQLCLSLPQRGWASDSQLSPIDIPEGEQTLRR